MTTNSKDPNTNDDSKKLDAHSLTRAEIARNRKTVDRGIRTMMDGMANEAAAIDAEGGDGTAGVGPGASRHVRIKIATTGLNRRTIRTSVEDMPAPRAELSRRTHSRKVPLNRPTAQSLNSLPYAPFARSTARCHISSFAARSFASMRGVKVCSAVHWASISASLRQKPTARPAR
jgi:hypothetical protein